MTEQVRLTGDRPSDPLDDSIAFSRYTEAIDRIILRGDQLKLEAEKYLLG